jgi:hypothetical protein
MRYLVQKHWPLYWVYVIFEENGKEKWWAISQLLKLSVRRFSILEVFLWRKFTRRGGRDTSVSIATCYGLDDRRIGVRVPVGSRIFTSSISQTGSGVHTTSYTIGTGESFPEVKRPRHEADHSPPASAEVKKMWMYTSTPPYVFMV